MLKTKKVLFPLAAFALVGFLSACGEDNPSNSGGSADKSDSSGLIDDGSSSLDEMTGSGTKADPYLISSAKQYGDFAAAYNALESAPKSTVYYKLGADIDLNGAAISPVGSSSVPFNGSFDGNGHKISGFSLDEFDKSVTAYGLFGYTEGASIYDLSIAIDYDLSPMGSKSQIFVGGLLGYGYNTGIENVSVEGSIDLTSAQNKSSYLFVGGVAGFLYAGDNYSVGVRNSSADVEIDSDMSDADDTRNAIGGISGGLGTLTSTSSIGVQYIASCHYSGSIVGGTAVGGITASMSTYTSVVDCYAEGESLEATDTDGAYVGGIVGQGYYESAVLHNFAGFSELKAAESTGSYKSYAGSAIGYAYGNCYDDDDDTLGTVNYANYAANDTKGSDVSGVDGIAAEKGEAAIQAAGLSSNWSVQDGKVVLGKYAGSDAKVNVTLDANYEGGSKDAITASSGIYDSSAVAAIIGKDYKRAGYSYVGMFYDKEGKQAYTWFTPFVSDTTLYASFGDLSALLGTWDYACNGVNGTWHFTEDTFYWQGKYYDVMKYGYTFDGTYIFIGEGDGDYEGEIFKLENGKITGHDVNGYEYTYTATKSSSTFVVPDYKGQSFLGTYYFSNGNYVILNADGSASGYSATSTTEWTGGFTKLADGTFNIRVPARLMADGLNYDATNDIFYNSDFFGARKAIDKTYATSDGKIKVYSTDSKFYAIKEGKLVSLSGDMSEGSEITVDGDAYTVSGTTLTVKTVAPSIPDEICGTYVSGTLEMTLNSDGKGTWDDGTNTYSFTFTYDAANKKATLSTVSGWDGTNYVTFGDDGSASVHLEDSILEDVVNKTMTKKQESTEAPSYVGTWSCKTAYATVELILNADGTGTYGGTAMNYTATETGTGYTIKFTVGGYDYELSYKSSSGTMSGSFDDGDGPYDFQAITKKEASEESGDTTPVSGKAALVGTWKDTNGNTMVLNDDGKGTWNDGTTTYDFEWTYDESTKKGTITDFGSFDDGENAFSFNDDGSISLSLSGNYGDNVYKPKMTKQA